MAKYGNFTQNGAYGAVDYRFSEAGPYARDAAGKVAPGVLYGSATDGRIRVSGTSLSIIVDPFHAVVPDSARGAYVGGLDVATVVGPFQPEVSNNRIDLVCWRPLEGQSVDSWGVTTMANITLAGSTTPVSKQVVNGEVYFVKGQPSSSTTPVVPATPIGSVRLGQVYVPGGAASITSANIDNSTKQWTSVVGGTVVQPGAVSGQATTLPAGSQAVNPTTGDLYVSRGGKLASVLVQGSYAPVLYKKIRNSAGGAGIGPTPIPTAPTYTIPASPFGVGVPYRVRVRGVGRGSCPPNTGFAVQVRIDGTVEEESTIGNGGNLNAYLTLEIDGGRLVTNPDVTHTAVATITSTNTNVTVLNDIMLNTYIELTPAAAL